MNWGRQTVMHGRRKGAGEQSIKGAVAGGSFPEHAQQKDGEQRCVHKSKNQLEQIHDVVKERRQISGGYRGQNAKDCGKTSYLEVMLCISESFFFRL